VEEVANTLNVWGRLFMIAWYWIIDIIVGRDLKAIGLFVMTLLVVAALLGWYVMAR
jgi:hypothetical protein